MDRTLPQGVRRPIHKSMPKKPSPKPPSHPPPPHLLKTKVEMTSSASKEASDTSSKDEGGDQTLFDKHFERLKELYKIAHLLWPESCMSDDDFQALPVEPMQECDIKPTAAKSAAARPNFSIGA